MRLRAPDGGPSRCARKRAGGVLCAGLLFLAVCDDGPGGGRLVHGRVVGADDLGAVVLEVRWPGIDGFEGLGSTQVYHAQLPGVESTHRVILLSPDGSELHFAIVQRSPRTGPPAVTVESAVGVDNLPLETSQIRVRVEEGRGIW